MHDAMNCPVCRAQRDLEIELVRDDRIPYRDDWRNSVDNEYKMLPDPRTDMTDPLAEAREERQLAFLNAVAQEWKQPLVRVGQGFYTTDYDPKPEPFNVVNALSVACIVAVGAALAAVAWAGGM